MLAACQNWPSGHGKLQLEQHRNPAWLDYGPIRWRHYYAGCVVVVLAARCRGQQDCSDGGAWWRCWDDVLLLHVVKRYARIFMALLCCQLKPLQHLDKVLFDTSAIGVHETKVELRLCKLLLGRFSVPLDCPFLVLFHTLTFGVH